MRPTLVSKGCHESLRGVDTPKIHRMRPTLVYKRCGESLRGVDTPKIHRMRPTLVYKGCSESLEGVQSLGSTIRGLHYSTSGVVNPCMV